MASAYIRTYKDESGLKDLESLREDLSSLAASKGETIDNWVEYHSDAGSCQAILSLLNRMPFEDSIYVEEVGRLGSTYGEILTALCVAVERRVRVYGLNDGFTLNYRRMDPGSFHTALKQAGRIYSNFISSRDRAALRRRQEEGVVLGHPAGACWKQDYLMLNKDKIIQALESGETKASIYRSYHVSPNTFKEFCNAVGWKRRGGYRKAKLKTSETGK